MQPSWNDLVEHQNFIFQDFPVSMQKCTDHFKSNAMKAKAFNVICSSFMLAQLDESSNITEEQKVNNKNVNIEKG